MVLCFVSSICVEVIYRHGYLFVHFDTSVLIFDIAVRQKMNKEYWRFNAWNNEFSSKGILNSGYSRCLIKHYLSLGQRGWDTQNLYLQVLYNGHLKWRKHSTRMHKIAFLGFKKIKISPEEHAPRPPYFVMYQKASSPLHCRSIPPPSHTKWTAIYLGK